MAVKAGGVVSSVGACLGTRARHALRLKRDHPTGQATVDDDFDFASAIEPSARGGGNSP